MLGCAQQESEAHVRGRRATNTPRQRSIPPNRRPIQQNQSLLDSFHPMGLHFGGHTPSTRGPAATKRGNCIIRAATRRRYSASQLLMLQNPHHSKPEVRRIVYKSLAQHRLVRKNRPTPPLRRHFREKTRPARLKTAFFGRFGLAGPTFSRSHPPSDRAGRTFSRTGSCDVTTLKPTTPLRAPEQRPLKPPSPLHPKNAPKTRISHPQRRHRFQSRLGRHPQRR